MVNWPARSMRGDYFVRAVRLAILIETQSDSFEAPIGGLLPPTRPLLFDRPSRRFPSTSTLLNTETARTIISV